MNVPDNLFYTKNHEWICINENDAIVGVTNYAQDELGDIIFIELPNKGTKFQSGDPVATIEAVKTVADIYIPLDGEILEVNRLLENEPEIINKDPYGKGWIIKLCNFPNDVSNLLTAIEYKTLIQ